MRALIIQSKKINMNYSTYLFFYKGKGKFLSKYFLTYIIMEILKLCILLLRYATTITLLFHILYYNFDNYLSNTMLLLSCIIFIGGLYITYIHPKFIYFPELDYKCKGNTLRLGDIFFHQLPFFYFLYIHFSKKKKFKRDNVIIGLFLIILYFLLFDVCNLYYIEVIDIVKILIVSFVLFFSISNYL